MSAPADLVLHGGTVWPGKGLPRASAIALRDERVLALGEDDEVRRLAGAATRVVDLGGRLVVPGFNDAHVHFVAGGAGLLSVDLRPATDEADLARRLAAHARTLPGGSWITQGNWDHEAWPGQALPARASIDPGTEGRFVLVQRLDGHMALASSAALAAAGIDRHTPDPPGGALGHDAAGEPTGILKDTAIELVRRVIPPPGPDETLRAARAAVAEAARVGVTTVQDNAEPGSLRAYLELRERGELTVRISLWTPVAHLAALAAAGLTAGLGDDWLRLGPVKVFSDGSLGSATAAFFEPYADDPSTAGLLVTPPEELARSVAAADRAGFPLAVHAIGDRANALVLDAFARLGPPVPGRRRLLRIEHAQSVRREDLARFRELGVIASVQPSHAADDLRWARGRVGGARLGELFRLRSFLDAGVAVAFGTDWFVEPLDPRPGLHAAVTRTPPHGVAAGDWRAEERVPLETALDLYTRGSAVAEGTSGRKGTLEPGRLADLAVLGEDLFTLERTDPRRILSAPVDLTVAGGRVVYERSA